MHKGIASAIWQHMLHIPSTKVLISEPLKQKKQPYKRAYISKNGGFRGKGQENGPKAVKDKTDRAIGPGRRRGYRKVGSD